MPRGSWTLDGGGAPRQRSDVVFVRGSVFDAVWAKDGPPHWKCKCCRGRGQLLGCRIFARLGVSPLQLVKLPALYGPSHLPPPDPVKGGN